MQASGIAMNHFQNNPKVILKPDNSPVTVADKTIATVLKSRLEQRFPDHFVITEETPLPQNLNTQSPVWVIDPIDGTYNFINGGDDWGISIGLLVDGKPVFGAFRAPVQDKTVMAFGGKIFLNGVEFHKERSPLQYLGEIALTFGGLKLIGPSLSHHLGGSTAHNMIKVALGQADIFFAPKAAIWDLAGGAALLQAAGLEVLNLDLTPVSFESILEGQSSPPLVAGDQDKIHELLKSLNISI